MARYASILEAFGRTPLVELPGISAGLGVTILGKLECLNPGGSSKDRIALAMVLEAEASGVLKPGGTIIEATAGNTGVGLAMVAAVRGYRCLFVIPDKMSPDKAALLRSYGAEVVITATDVPPDSPENYNRLADRLAHEIAGAWRPDQFGNAANPTAHYETTGPEIWEDAGGRIDVFVAGVGTGGTVSGVGRYLKERDPSVKVIVADPEGSILSGGTPGSWKVEGIGEDFIPKTFDADIVDGYVRVSDAESFAAARRLAREEGILVGGSSGTALHAALTVARDLPRGATVVVLLPDTGRNYLSKQFSDSWMSDNGFLDGDAPETAGDLLRAKRMQPLVTASPRMRAADAARLMDSYAISQLPVTSNGRVIGSLDEVTLLRRLHDDADLRAATVDEVMGRPMPQVDEGDGTEEVYRKLLGSHGGVVVTREGMALGFLSRSDLVGYLSQHPGRKKVPA
ncbi:MAG: pyridoxal-phosphate dependent enzyme [Coriobacteriia bacterium]